MEEQKKSREQQLQEQVEKLQEENKKLQEEKALYEGWWRNADAKNLELAETIKSICTLAGMIYKSAKN